MTLLRLLRLALWFPAAAVAAVGVSDDAGRAVRLERPAERVISLAPHATELLFAAGAGARLIAAVEFSDYPPAARELPRVGRAGAVDLERVLALRPDLVVAWSSGTPAVQHERLQALGIPVFLSEPRTLADIPDSLRRLGVLTGTGSAAEQAARAFETQLDTLRRRYAARPRLRGFYQIWPQPLMTVNGRHLISRVMDLCGVDNVFAGLSALVPRVDMEAVLAADPQIVFSSGEADAGWEAPWLRWRELAAVRAGTLFHLDPDLIHRPTPRILEGAARLCAAAETARRRLRGE